MQYAILTKNPEAGKPGWHCDYGIAFNSKESAMNAVKGTIDSLRRAGDKMDGREWQIAAVEWPALVTDAGFWARLKLAFAVLFKGQTVGH